MLRRRGIQATLYYGGATLPQEGLSAHVWVQDGTVGIVGHEVAGAYRIVLQYPDGGRHLSAGAERAGT
jgi:hypothetical protein